MLEFQKAVTVHVWARDLLAKSGLEALFSECEAVRVERSWAQGTVEVVACNAIDSDVIEKIRTANVGGCERIMLVAGSVGQEILGQLINAGVRGIVRSGEATSVRLGEAAEAVAGGGGTLPPDLVGLLLRDLPVPMAQRLDRRRNCRLAEREEAVLRLLAEGYDTFQIAEELHYSERTIKGVVHGIIRRFGLRNRPHAVAFALRQGLI